MSSPPFSSSGETKSAGRPVAMPATDFESSKSTNAIELPMDARTLPTVPGYRVVRWLGGGGMGDVYEVMDERLDVRFALKMIRPDRDGESFRERFRHEIKALLLLDHPHIARIYSHDEVDGCPYFTMKFAAAGTLADRRNDFVGHPEQAVALLAKVADAVDYLHRQGKVHRDLKPSNVLFDDRGEPVVGDFGLVKDIAVIGNPQGSAIQVTIADTPVTSSTDETASMRDGAGANGGITRTGAAIGTVAYMSPEQARGDKGAVGPATDIWALGIILFEMLVGDRPDLTKTPIEHQPNFDCVPKPLAQIVTRCLARDPIERFNSAAELATGLRAWLEPPSTRAPAISRRWVVAGIAVLTSIVVIVAAIRRGGDPGSAKPSPAPNIDDLRREARVRMAAGEIVTLIDRDGNAAPFLQMIVGEKFSRSSREPGGWWGLHSTDAALVEFFDDPGLDSFTLTGEVRGVRTIGLPTAGLFVSHRRIADSSGVWDFQAEYGFKEAPDNLLMPPVPPGPGDKAIDPKVVVPDRDWDTRRALRLFGAAYEGHGSAPVTIFARPLTDDRPTIDGPWRTLEIRVNGAAFTTYWEGKLEFSVPQLPVWMVKGVQDCLQVPPVPPLTFSARGGLGVYVYGGSASFRNVTIRSGTPVP